MMPFPSLRATQRYNYDVIRKQPLNELSGSLGDLGTLLPLLIALVIQDSISLPATLLFMGVSNIATGVAFGFPLPVQPMKAIAAVALAKDFSMREMSAAGIVMGAAVGVLSLTGLIRWVEKRIPKAVVKGIMVGAGLSLCISAGSLRLMGHLSWIGPWWGDNLLIAIAAAVLLLVSLAFPRFPYALTVFVVGLALSFVRVYTTRQHDHTDIPDGVGNIPIVVPNRHDFLDATFSAALGQLPLTLLNSIIAVTALSSSLFPSRTAPSTTHLGISIALMNLVAPWFGGMPACHGSGGLASQYRFGARSGFSVVLLGTLKIIIAIVALINGQAIAKLIAEFPRAILGIMVLAAGVELARAGITIDESSGHQATSENEDTSRPSEDTLEIERKDHWLILLVTVAGILAFKNDAVGFVAGMCWHWATVWVRTKKTRRSWIYFGRYSSNEERRRLLS
jgi:hypothetical protein